MSLAIYTDSNFFDTHWLVKLKLPEYQLFHFINDYVESIADVKIAFTTERFCLDYEKENRMVNGYTTFPFDGFEEKIQKLSSVSDMVFSFDGEIHDHYFDIWRQCDADNVYWVIPGQVENIKDRIIPWHDWFKIVQNIYKNLVPGKLKEIKYNASKHQCFDALLGRQGIHRTFIWENILKNNLLGQIISTYHNINYIPHNEPKTFIWEKNLIPVDKNVLGTFCRADYYGHNVPISAVIPIDVYNQTAYSIIAETNYNNAYSFYTEKTAKPLIARRLFVAFSGQHFLKNLRSVGFKTFNGIIDETYDTIENNEERWAAAFEQVKLLCELDQTEVYQRARDILEHNFNLIYNTDWNNETVKQIQNTIDKLLN